MNLLFSGVIYAHQHEPIKSCVDDIELILAASTFGELRGEIRYVPL